MHYNEKECYEQLAAERQRAEQAEAKIAYYEGRGGTTMYEVVAGMSGDKPPAHKFTDEGLCIRCGEDAEEWDAGCVEELLEQAEAHVAQLRQALEMVEYVYGRDDDADTLHCPWCRRRCFDDSGWILDHAPTCPRQLALAGEPQAALVAAVIRAAREELSRREAWLANQDSSDSDIYETNWHTSLDELHRAVRAVDALRQATKGV